MSFGEKLAKLRKEKGMSQESLAQELNVSRQAVSKWESNSAYPETEKIIAICKLFDVSIDELLGIDSKTKIATNNTFVKKINYYIDAFLNGIKLFYNMSFKQKIKCLLEMAFYAFILCILLFIVSMCIYFVASELLTILPYYLYQHILSMLEGILLLVDVLLIGYLLLKLYKVRFLDYYLEVKNEIEIKEDIQYVPVTKEKIIIRDSKNNSKFLEFIKLGTLAIAKGILGMFTIPLIIIFVILIAMLIFTLAFINKGLLLVYGGLFLIGCILGVYLIIEIFIKTIFNLKVNFKKIFIMLICSLLILGSSSGLLAYELTSYKIVNNKLELRQQFNIPMQDNLLILNLYPNKVIYEDREDIYIEIYDDNDFFNYNYEVSELKEYNNNYLAYHFNDIEEFNINDLLTIMLDNIKNKEIHSYDDYQRVVMHISESNYQKLLNNLKEYEW